jgi:hypothetical protein
MARFRDPAVAGLAAGMSGGGDFVMGDWGGVPGMQPGTQHLLLAEILGLAMARRAADILDRHRAALMGAPPGGPGEAGRGEADDAQLALDNAIFTAVLDAANECLGQFDARPADERWCDALLQLIQLAQVARDPAGPGQPG